jgi:hypothetical protein
MHVDKARTNDLACGVDHTPGFCSRKPTQLDNAAILNGHVVLEARFSSPINHCSVLNQNIQHICVPFILQALKWKSGLGEINLDWIFELVD